MSNEVDLFWPSYHLFPFSALGAVFFLLTFNCCWRSLRVGATISCGTEFFFDDFDFGLVPVCRLLLLFALLFWLLLEPGAIFFPV